jgi:hypothetical protein
MTRSKSAGPPGFASHSFPTSSPRLIFRKVLFTRKSPGESYRASSTTWSPRAIFPEKVPLALPPCAHCTVSVTSLTVRDDFPTGMVHGSGAPASSAVNSYDFPSTTVSPR